MGGKSKSPDYEGAAIAQGEANRGVVRDQTFANRPDQYSYTGSTQWNPYQTVDPATGEATTAWDQVTKLSPELQSIYDKQVAIQGGRSDVAGMLINRMGNEFSQGMDWRGLNPMGQVPTSQFTMPEETQRVVDYSGAPGMQDPAALRQRAEDSIYDKGAARLGSQYTEQRRAMENKMRNQGLGPEDQAWKTQMLSIGQSEGDAYNNLQASAIDQGMGEQNQLYNQNLGQRNQYTGEIDRRSDFYNRSGQQVYGQSAAANEQNFQQQMKGSAYSNQIRQQQLSEAMQKRGFSLNEINALLSGQQVQAPSMPNFTGAAAAEAAPIYQGAVDQGNFDQASQQMMTDAVTGIAGAAM